LCRAVKPAWLKSLDEPICTSYRRRTGPCPQRPGIPAKVAATDVGHVAEPPTERASAAPSHGKRRTGPRRGGFSRPPGGTYPVRRRRRPLPVNACLSSPSAYKARFPLDPGRGLNGRPHPAQWFLTSGLAVGPSGPASRVPAFRAFEPFPKGSRGFAPWRATI
jgi:hypothetical protein